MVATTPLVVTGAVEGNLDEAVVRRLARHCGAELGKVYGKNGRPHLLGRIPGFNEGARLGAIWFVLVDLDQKPECAPALVAEVLPDPATGMCFRVAVREVEAWILADRGTFASWVRVRKSLIPSDTEAIPYPKERLIDIVRQSPSRYLRRAIVPAPNSGRTEGELYTSTLSEFVANRWDIEAAARAAPSLERAIRCLKAKIASPPVPGQ